MGIAASEACSGARGVVAIVALHGNDIVLVCVSELKELVSTYMHVYTGELQYPDSQKKKTSGR